MAKPTKEEIKEFWELCGLKRNKYGHWELNDGPYLDIQLDLNNLFKYAVPKEIDYLPTYRLLFDKWLEWLEDLPDPALALFWALWDLKKIS